MDPNRSADRVFLASCLAGAVTFGACIYAFIEGSRSAPVSTPEEEANLPADTSESADDSPNPSGDE